MKSAGRTQERATILELLELGEFDAYFHSKRERRERRREHDADLALQLARIVEESKGGRP
jgi:hypothetical protein